MTTLMQDLRYAMRGLARHPGFAAVAILTLALGIGTVTTIFSILDAAVLRPLPYRDPASLMTVSITHRDGNEAAENFPWSSPKFESFRRHATSFERAAAWSTLDLNLTGVAEPERLAAEIVSAAYFPVLGVDAAVGRVLAAGEDAHGATPVAVLSWGLWQRRFGGDPGAVGRSVQINRQPLTIIGVMPRPFNGLSGGADIWVPMSMAPVFVYPEILQEDGNHWHNVVARRKAGVPEASAVAEMAVVGRQIADEHPMEIQGAIWSAAASPLNDLRVDPALRRSVVILFGAVTFVLLIACANVAALLLARAAARGREVAIRVAIGAGRRRIVRQMLTESLVLALAGGVAGVLLSLWGVESLSRLEKLAGVGDPSFLFRFAAIELDGRVLGFALAVSVATGLLFGLAPALHASRTDLAEALKEGGAGAVSGAGRRRLSARGLLVPFQVALALVLLVGAGLLTRSLARLSGYGAGFQGDRVLTLRFDPSGVTDDGRAGAIVFRRQLLERLAAVPSIESAATGRTAPLASRNMVAIVKQVDEKKFESKGRFTGEQGAVEIGLHDVAPDFFRTLAIPIRKGRAFTPQDREGSPKVVVSESTARKLWPGQDPIGRRIAATSFYFADDATAEVVGVAGDVLYGKPGDRQILDLYYPTFQAGLPWATLFVKTKGDPASVAPAIRREIQALSPNLPVFDVATMAQRSARTFSRERFGAGLLSLLAAIALFLASVGIYGLVAETVASRSREIGVRMALGARPADILRSVLQHSLALAGLGLAAGIAAALALSRLLSSLLFGVAATDAATYAGVSILLLAVAAVASWLPARRATRIDPTLALRAE